MSSHGDGSGSCSQSDVVPRGAGLVGSKKTPGDFTSFTRGAFLFFAVSQADSQILEKLGAVLSKAQ